jgi:WD40 repeat protein
LFSVKFTRRVTKMRTQIAMFSGILLLIQVTLVTIATAAESRLIFSESIVPITKPVVVRVEAFYEDKPLEVCGLRSHWAVRPAIFDFLQDPPWIEVTGQWSGTHTANLDLGHLSAGRYEAALVLKELPGLPSLTHPLRIAGRVSVADPDRPVHVTVFTDRNRQVFVAGEAIGITLSCGVAPGERAKLPDEVHLDLILRQSEGGWARTLDRIRFNPHRFAGKRTSFRRVIHPDWSLALAEGEYQIEVEQVSNRPRGAGNPVRSFPLRIVDKQYKSGTASPMYLLGSNTWTGGQHTFEANASRESLREGIDNINAILGGFGADCVVTYGDRVSTQRPGDLMVDVPYPHSPLLGACERLATPENQNPFVLAALAHGCSFITMPFQIDNPFFPVADHRDVDEMHWDFASVGNRFRWLPNFVGYLNSMYWTPTPVTAFHGGSNAPADPNTHMREQKLYWEDFCQRTGIEGNPPTNWTKHFGLPRGGDCVPENREMWRKWCDDVCRMYARSQNKLRATTGRGIPGVIHTDIRSQPQLASRWTIYGPDSGLYSPYQDPERSFEGLDIISATGWNKHGDNLCYEPLFWGDLFAGPARKAGAALWTPGFGCTTTRYTEILKHVGMNLARGAVPAYLMFNTNALPYTNTGGKWCRANYGFREELKLAFDFTQCYGELAVQAQRRGPVAILASWHQGIFQSSSGTGNSYGADLWELIGGLYLANYPATFLYESDIQAGRLDEFKILIVTGQKEPLPKGVLKAMQKFVDSNGVILADEKVTATLPITERVDLGLGDWWRWSTQRDKLIQNTDPPRTFADDDYQQAECYRITLKHRDKLRGLLKKYATPFADCKLPFVFCSTLQTGDGRLVFAINDTGTGSPFAREMSYQLPSWNLPVKTDIGFATKSAGHIYDLWAQEEVFGKSGDGRQWIRADLTRHAFRAYYHVPTEPVRLRLVAPKLIQLGSVVKLGLNWLDLDGQPVTFPVPVEASLKTPQGEVQTTLRRCVPSDGRTVALKIPLNADMGQYRLKVTSLLDGRSFEQTLNVQSHGKEPQPLLDTSESSPANVIVHEPERIREFLTQGEYAVVIGNEQPMAKSIRAIAKDLTAPVKSVEEASKDTHGLMVYRKDVTVWPLNRVEEPVLLIGSRSGNPLIAELLKTASTIADFTPNSPGPGGGMILWVPSAFDGARDAVLALANDPEGLAAVGKQLLRLRDKPPTPGERTNLHDVRRMFIPQDVRALRVARAANGEDAALKNAGSSFSSDHSTEDGALATWILTGLQGPQTENVLASRPGHTSRWSKHSGICAYALAPAGGRQFVVTSDSWDRNIFQFDGERVDRWWHAETPLIHQVGISPQNTVVAAEGMQPAAVVAYRQDGTKVWKLPVAFQSYDGSGWAYKLNAECDYLALSPDRSVVYLVDRQLVLHARQIDSGRDLWTRQLTPSAERKPPWYYKEHIYIPSIVLSADGKVLYLAIHCGGAIDPQIVRVETATGHIDWSIPVPSRRTIKVWRDRFTGLKDGRRLAVNVDGSRLALCDILGNLRLWDGAGRELRSLPSKLYTDGSVFDLAFSPNGRFLAACPLEQYQYGTSTKGSSINRLYLFDLVEKQQWVFDPDEQISDAAFDHTGQRLLWSAWDGRVRAWDLDKRRELWSAAVGSGCQLLALPDGQTAVATYYGDVICLRRDGQTNWRKNLTPLSYPQPLYEPGFERGQ